MAIAMIGGNKATTDTRSVAIKPLLTTYCKKRKVKYQPRPKHVSSYGMIKLEAGKACD